MSTKEAKSIWGLQKSQPDQARQIERIFGVSFVEKPWVSKLNAWNSIMIAVQDPTLLAFMLYYNARFDSLGHNTFDYNAIFFSRDWNMQRLPHELGHSLIHQINPGIKNRIENIVKKKKEKIPKEEWEECMSYLSFHEGFAEWVQIETAADTLGVSNKREINNAHIDGIYSTAYKGIKKTDPGKVLATCMERLVDGMYPENYYEMRAVGHFFVFNVMNKLTQGLFLGDAVTMLIHNPPKSLADLGNPIPYAEQLLEKGVL